MVNIRNPNVSNKCLLEIFLSHEVYNEKTRKFFPRLAYRMCSFFSFFGDRTYILSSSPKCVYIFFDARIHIPTCGNWESIRKFASYKKYEVFECSELYFRKEEFDLSDFFANCFLSVKFSTICSSLSVLLEIFDCCYLNSQQKRYNGISIIIKKTLFFLGLEKNFWKKIVQNLWFDKISRKFQVWQDVKIYRVFFL